MTDGIEPSGDADPAPGPARQPIQRAADADRDRTVTLLREHVVVGRLTLDEFSERVGSALAARTRGELEALVADLPAQPEPEPEATRRHVRRWIVAVMSGATAKGRWRVGDHTTAIAVMGGCVLDLRQAEIYGSEAVINAFAIMGGIDIIVPEGIDVELAGFAVMGGRNSRIRDIPIIPGSPRIIIRAFPIMGGVEVRSRPSGRGARDRVDDRSLDRASGAPSLDPGHEGGADQFDRHRGHVDRHADRPALRDDRRDPVAAPAAPGSEPGDGGDRTVTILFSDMVDYSGITERLGDRSAQALVTEHHRIVRSLLGGHGGREVKVQGDGFMAAFGGVSRALRCAVAMQRSFREHTLAHPDQPIRVHIGLHTGEAMEVDDDYFGHTVIVASRIAGLAVPDEILVSSLSAQLVAGTGEFHFGEQREVALKGMSRPQTVAALIWAN
ncbi:MAG TPA: adenylate/guanylate cyclase domain-containing protein [Acidimicrobiales bacterium]|nr:adenylate/guanylate cyclase domain-containing protein [Acidimicrobiales bacterium]